MNITHHRATQTIAGTHWPLLGTVVDLRIEAIDRAEAARAERIVVDEIGRLEKTFSMFDETSLLRRWITDPAVSTSAEFDELLSIALGWQRCSAGAFNVRTRGLWDVWEKAAAEGCRPNRDELLILATTLLEPPYRFDGHRLVQIADCRDVNLNAIAKGFIVDLATDAAWRTCDLTNLTVSAGGDIAHRGETPIEIGIEDATCLNDNAPPIHTIQIQNGAVATSGSTRRGLSVEGDRISHVLNPRTGQPADTSMTVTIVAPDATTADAVATIVSVLDLTQGLRFVDSLNAAGASTSGGEPIGCWILDSAATLHHTGPANAPA